MIHPSIQPSILNRVHSHLVVVSLLAAIVLLPTHPCFLPSMPVCPCSLFAVHCSLFTVRYSLFVVCLEWGKGLRGFMCTDTHTLYCCKKNNSRTPHLFGLFHGTAHITTSALVREPTTTADYDSKGVFSQHHQAKRLIVLALCTIFHFVALHFGSFVFGRETWCTCHHTSHEATLHFNQRL